MKNYLLVIFLNLTIGMIASGSERFEADIAHSHRKILITGGQLGAQQIFTIIGDKSSSPDQIQFSNAVAAEINSQITDLLSSLTPNKCGYSIECSETLIFSPTEVSRKSENFGLRRFDGLAVKGELMEVNGKKNIVILYIPLSQLIHHFRIGVNGRLASKQVAPQIELIDEMPVIQFP